MKRTDLEKLKGAKINNRLKQAGTPQRYARGTADKDKPALSPLVAKLLQRRKDGD